MRLNAEKKLFAVAALLCAQSFTGCSSPDGHAWNRKAAAAYLDSRAAWWEQWDEAARDQQTFCVSCHTAIPYALARPVLANLLAEQTPTAEDRQLVENVRRRVRLWQTIGPYYPKQAEASRGTEAVLNAVILASNDVHLGVLSSDTRLAFDHLWTLQQASGPDAGAWAWIRFDNQPWEAADSAYYGATLAALAVGMAPDRYQESPEIQEPLARLRTYLNDRYQAQSPLSRIELLFASTYLPDLVDRERQQSIINNIWSCQQADGGWAAASFIGSWTRRDGTALPTQSDGYATGLITLALERVGVGADDARLARGVSWLLSNQSRWNGRWIAYSLNQWRNPWRNGPPRFMDDAASAYAVLALAQREARSSPLASAGPTYLAPMYLAPMYDIAHQPALVNPVIAPK